MKAIKQKDTIVIRMTLAEREGLKAELEAIHNDYRILDNFPLVKEFRMLVWSLK